jgi:hypothetical protein
MSALTGRSAKIKYTSAAYSTAAGEAFTSLSASTDRTEFRITDGSKRHWSRVLPPVVSVNSTSHTDFAWNPVQGKLTFGTALSTADSALVTATVYWLTASFLPWTRSWSLDVDVDMLDITTLSTTTGDQMWRTFTPGLSGATVDLGRIVDTPTTATPLWFDHLNTDQDVILELHTGSTYKFEAYARVETDGYTNGVDALQDESVTLRVDGPLYYATTE